MPLFIINIKTETGLHQPSLLQSFQFQTFKIIYHSNFKTVHHNRAYTVSVGLKYTDCFTSVVDKVKTLIKTVCCLFAVGLRRVNGRRES